MSEFEFAIEQHNAIGLEFDLRNHRLLARARRAKNGRVGISRCHIHEPDGGKGKHGRNPDTVPLVQGNQRSDNDQGEVQCVEDNEHVVLRIFQKAGVRVVNIKLTVTEATMSRMSLTLDFVTHHNVWA